jgi:hypothetical protein
MQCLSNENDCARYSLQHPTWAPVPILSKAVERCFRAGGRITDHLILKQYSRFLAQRCEKFETAD